MVDDVNVMSVRHDAGQWFVSRRGFLSVDMFPMPPVLGDWLAQSSE